MAHLEASAGAMYVESERRSTFQFWTTSKIVLVLKKRKKLKCSTINTYIHDILMRTVSAFVGQYFSLNDILFS